MDFYTILGLAKDASADDIKKAFRKKAKENHPDREGGSDEMMAAINQAYGVLSDPNKRARYDATGDFGEMPNIEQQAESLIMTMFSRCMASRITGSVVWQVKQGLFAEGEALKTHSVQLQGQSDMLAARRKTVKAPGAKNLAHMVVDQQIQSINQMLQQKKEQMEIYAKALIIIEDYEDIEPSVEPEEE